MTLAERLRSLHNIPDNVTRLPIPATALSSVVHGMPAVGPPSRPALPLPPETGTVPEIVAQILSKHLSVLLDATPETLLEKSENVLIVADQLKRSVALISSMMADSGRMYADAAEQEQRKREAEVATHAIDIRERLAAAIESMQIETAIYEERSILAEKREAALLKEAATNDRQLLYATDAQSVRRRYAAHLLALEAIATPEGAKVHRPVLLFARAVFRHFGNLEKTVEALVQMDSLSYVIPNDIAEQYLAELDSRKLRASRDHEREMEQLRLEVAREKRKKLEALATSI